MNTDDGCYKTWNILQYNKLYCMGGQAIILCWWINFCLRLPKKISSTGSFQQFPIRLMLPTKLCIFRSYRYCIACSHIRSSICMYTIPFCLWLTLQNTSTRNKDSMMVFYDYLAKNWQHIRATDLTESVFAIVRLMTAKTRIAGVEPQR